MTNISTIPIAELRKDYAAATLDLNLCKRLLFLMNPDDERRASYLLRVDGNKKVIKAIEIEIDMRADESSRERDDV